MKLSKIFSYLILIISLMSVNQWSALPLGNDFLYFLVGFSIILNVLFYQLKYSPEKDTHNYPLILFLLWTFSAIVRGTFVAENYWEWKALAQNTLAILLPLLIYFFSQKTILQNTLQLWVKYALPLFVIFALLLITPDSYGFYLGPIWLFGLLLPALNRRWQIIVFVLLVILLTLGLSNRSTIIKTAIVFSLLILYQYRRLISLKLIKFFQISLFVLPIILLFIGLTGIFNVFQMDEYIKTNSSESELTSDTRSFIFEEQIFSAIQNNYVIWGRTPARGFDSIYGESLAMSIYKADNSKGAKVKFERQSCEVVHLNIFNYLGIIGVVLYSILYFQSSYLAVNKSKNIFIKMIGLFIAFRWGYGWVEDFNRFDIMNMSLWMMIAMGYSSQFRNMTNGEITVWVRGIFDVRYKYLNNGNKHTYNSSINNLPQP